jgi:hypothetical protein
MPSTGFHRQFRLCAIFAGALLSTLLSAVPAAAAAPSMSPDELADYQPKPYITIKHPEWTKNATIYQINTRHFTPEGTFRAAEAHLPRLKAMHIDIVWLMPVHEIGQLNRKGTLGSPYSVRDYYSVNPEFGTLADLKHFVDAAHALGLKVILDWVANHTAWDNVLVSQHPDWYDRDHKGNFRPTPWWDWSDIIDLDFRQPGLRKYMTEAMKYWVREVGVDGYRCDVAGFVPVDFWNKVRRGTRPHQARLHARRVGDPRPSCRRVRHDLRLELERGDAQDRHRQGRRERPFHLLLMERMFLPARKPAHDVCQQPRQECVGRHGVRAVRRRPRRLHRPLGHRRGHAPDLQRPGGGQPQAAEVL